MADGRADGSSEALLPKSDGKPRVVDRRVLSGIIFVNRNGLRWRDGRQPMGRIRRATIAGSGGVKPVSSFGGWRRYLALRPSVARS